MVLLKAFGRRFFKIRDQNRHINAILPGLLPSGFDGLARTAFHGRKITHADPLRQVNKKVSCAPSGEPDQPGSGQTARSGIFPPRIDQARPKDYDRRLI